MAINAGSLAAQLIDGGLSPTAAKTIANAIANASSPQFSEGGDTADVTPTDKLRLISADTRRYELSNLDYSPAEPFNERLAGLKGLYANPDTDHPYKDAQPRVTAPPLSAPAVRGSDYIAIDTGEEQNATVHTVRLKLQKQNGQHLRINSATSNLDAVPIQAISQTPKYLAAEVRETDTGSEVLLTIRGIQQIDAVLSDGSTQPVAAWTAGAATTNGAFTGWAKTNLLSATSATAARRAMLAPFAWACFNGGSASTSSLTGCTYSRTAGISTVTITTPSPHNFLVGHEVFCDFTSGVATDQFNTVASTPTPTTFTINNTGATTAATGNVTLTRQTVLSSENVHSVIRYTTGSYCVNLATACSGAGAAVCNGLSDPIPLSSTADPRGSLNNFANAVVATAVTVKLGSVDVGNQLQDQTYMSLIVFAS